MTALLCSYFTFYVFTSTCLSVVYCSWLFWLVCVM